MQQLINLTYCVLKNRDSLEGKKTNITMPKKTHSNSILKSKLNEKSCETELPARTGNNGYISTKMNGLKSNSSSGEMQIPDVKVSNIIGGLIA